MVPELTGGLANHICYLQRCRNETNPSIIILFIQNVTWKFQKVFSFEIFGIKQSYQELWHNIIINNSNKLCLYSTFHGKNHRVLHNKSSQFSSVVKYTVYTWYTAKMKFLSFRHNKTQSKTHNSKNRIRKKLFKKDVFC